MMNVVAVPACCLTKQRAVHSFRASSQNTMKRTVHGRYWRTGGQDCMARPPRNATIAYAANMNSVTGFEPDIFVIREDIPASSFVDLDGTVAINADLPGILPASSFIPVNPGEYFRAPWADAEDTSSDESQVSEVGKGFQRERNIYTPSALDFTPAPTPRLVTSQNQVFDIVETSLEFTKTTTMKGKVKVSGWGFKKSKSFESSRTVKYSESSLTCTLMRDFRSTPVMVIDPLVAPVGLSDRARRLLRDEGPTAFHDKYGTHYVAGYTSGGTFSGYLQLHFVDVQRTQKGKGKVAKQLSKSAADATAATGFEKEIEDAEGFDSIEGGYNVVGWAMGDDEDGNALPSQSEEVSTLEELLEASNSILLSADEKMDAVLGSYQSLPEYQQARAVYEKKRGDSAIPYVPVSQESFFAISDLLSDEFLALDFQSRLLEGLPSDFPPSNILEQEAIALTEKPRQAQQNIQYLFSKSDDARANWVSLAAYLRHVRDNNVTKIEATIEGDDATSSAAESGRKLAELVFVSGALKQEHDDFRKRISVGYEVIVTATVKKTGTVDLPPPPVPTDTDGTGNEEGSDGENTEEPPPPPSPDTAVIDLDVRVFFEGVQDSLQGKLFELPTDAAVPVAGKLLELPEESSADDLGKEGASVQAQFIADSGDIVNKSAEELLPVEEQIQKLLLSEGRTLRPIRAEVSGTAFAKAKLDSEVPETMSDSSDSAIGTRVHLNSVELGSVETSELVGQFKVPQEDSKTLTGGGFQILVEYRSVLRSILAPDDS